jgi:hypothetical protein
MPGRRVQGITAVESDSSKPRRTVVRSLAGDLNERLACAGKESRASL